MGADRLIYIRTDGNRKIASGHLVRCFSIALACLESGMKVCFLVSDMESYQLLCGMIDAQKESAANIKHDIPVIKLNTAAYDHLEQELPEVISLLSSCSAAIDTASNDTDASVRDAVYFLDSYYVTEKYLSALNPLIKTAYLDDLQLFDYSVSLVINYDLIPAGLMASCRSAYQNAQKLLLGAAYTPLRRQFQDRRITIKKQITDILIATGGSDPYHFCLNITQKITSASKSLPSAADTSCITFHIVAGKLNTDRDALLLLTENLPFFRLHENISDMASLMEKCDLAVSAAGTTLYELCALGIPAISFTMADNQIPSARAFHETGAIPYAGDIRHTPDRVYENVLSFISNSTFADRKSAHKIMCGFVDGKGALRIAMALKEL